MQWVKWLSLCVFLLSYQAQACLRSSPDERAVQWSLTVVKATLLGQKTPAAGNPPLDPVSSIWKVTESFDGPLKADAEITLLTFPSADPEKPAPACQELPTKGKSAVLLLRPAKDCEFAVQKNAAQLDGYVIVARLAEEEATEDAIKNLKEQIALVRKAEAAFSDKDAKFQAETLANAVDETEAEHAEDALVDMGPKALAAVKDQLTKASPAGRNRLQRVVAELSPPPADTGKRADASKE
jgi:hypothetical protein